MIVLFGATSGPANEARAESRANIGTMLTPAGLGRLSNGLCAADNGCYSHRHDPVWWAREGESAWLRMLDKIRMFAPPPIFVILPDVVGDWQRTLERAHRYLPVLEDYGLPPAIALQDGCEGAEQYRQVESLGVGVLFVGGTTAWKLRNIAVLRKRFRREWLHVGRVSGWKRLEYCMDCKVDSVDGTGWVRNYGKELPKLFRTLDDIHPQTRMREMV